MSKKDPAFLFYSKDWIEGTAEMTAEEKGIFIDLLAHQHQKGSLPAETKRLAKIAGISEDEFLPIWSHVSSKFKLQEDGRLVNYRLTEVVTERLDRGLKNKIISVLGVCVRKSNFPAEIKNFAKKGFLVDSYIGVEEPLLTEIVTKWFTERCTERLASLEDGNGNEDAIVFNNTSVIEEVTNTKEGESEKKWNTMPKEVDVGGLTDVQIGSVIEYIKITKKVDIDIGEITGLWGVFKTKNLTGKKYYDSEHGVYTHFLEWLKFQKIEENKLEIGKNGIDKRNIGAYQLLEKGRKKFDEIRARSGGG